MLVFSFVCLPFDSDKVRLRYKLQKWLCIYFGFIMLVLLCSVTGVALVLIHDEEKNHQILCINEVPQYFQQSCYFQNWERIIWSCTLIVTPFVVLAYHVYFWKSVCLIYDAIDLSKSIIKSDKIFTIRNIIYSQFVVHTSFPLILVQRCDGVSQYYWKAYQIHIISLRSI